MQWQPSNSPSEYVSTDQSYEVDLNDAPMQFIGGNSCTLSYNGIDNSCHISIQVNDDVQTSEYILHIDPIVGTTLPIAQGEDTKRVLTKLFRFHSVSFGSRHACAMDDNAMLYCWGYNAYYTIAENPIRDINIPVQLFP